MIVGCYALDLYCENDMRHRVGQFTGETGGEARANARRAGWYINLKDNRALCPKCAKRRKEKSRDAG